MPATDRVRATGPSPRPTHRSLLGVSLGIGALSVALALGATSTLGGAKTDKPGTSDLAIAEITSFDISVTASGELEAKNQVQIRCKLEKPAAIVEIVDEGTVVVEGQELVKLNSEDIETQLNQETLQVESATADAIAAENAYDIQVNENASNTDKAQVASELARIEHQKWLQGDDTKQRQKLALAIEKADRNKSRLEEKAAKSKSLFAKQFLSKDEYEIDQIAAIEAAANLEVARLESQVYEGYEREKMQTKLQSDIRQAESELERVESKNAALLASKEADRNNKRKQLTLRQDKKAKLEEQLANCIIKAPRDGLVVYGSTAERSRFGGFGGDEGMKIGQQVHPNQLMIVLPDTREMVASVRVHEANAGRIRPGQTALIRIDAAQGRSFTGTVASIGVMAESGGWRDPNLREYTVKIGLDSENDLSGLKPSMRCEAQVVLGRVENALAAPIQAIFNDGPVRYVHTPEGSKYVKTAVKVGRRSDTMAEIRAGLKAGQKVLLREPAPGEVLAREWDAETLAALDKAAPDMPGMGAPGGPGGAPVMMQGGRPGAPGSGPGAAAPGAGQRGGGRGQRGEGAKGVATAAAPGAVTGALPGAKPADAKAGETKPTGEATDKTADASAKPADGAALAPAPAPGIATEEKKAEPASSSASGAGNDAKPQSGSDKK